MTIAQYVAAVRRCTWCPPDLRGELYIQEDPRTPRRGHLVFWRKLWEGEGGRPPACAIRIPVVQPERPERPVRVAPEAPRPKELVERIYEVQLRLG